MNTSRPWFIGIALPVLFTVPGAWAGPPTDQLKPAVERVIRILQDPALKREVKTAERRGTIRAVSDGIFDWREMAKRSLGPHWRGRTEAEREEFVRLFRDLLERSYISIIERYSGEQITYAGDSVDGGQAIVRTKFLTKQGKEVSIDYRMMRQGDRWLIYDVLVETVGLVGNYRAQFNQIIRAFSFEELVKRMRGRELANEAS
ncbi:MAG: ABC transporter substrate-binding protein [Candidatus Rokubacteria bacterium]|nr:ABC transporter substrate-binding protein [Candidatus Rokubacteria bacterium]